MNKKGLSPIVSIILLLLILTIVLVSIRSEVTSITQTVFDSQRDTEQEAPIEVIELLEDGTLYVGVSERGRFSPLTQIQLDDQDCLINVSNLTFGINEIDLSNACDEANITTARNIFYTIEGKEYVERVEFVPTSVQSDSSVDCSSIPGDWIEVPGNSYFGTSDFCVMQFEAKDVSNVATSQPSSTPWRGINIQDARSACTDLNTQYSSLEGTFKLITNREWMTIARNAEQQGANWDSGTVGSGSMYRGHSDNNPSNALAVSDTGDYYDGTGNSAPSIERRVLELSNGEIIWDLGGNVYEWVDMLEDGSSFNGNACSEGDNWYSYFGNDGQSECSFVAPYSKDSAADTRYEMGPLGDYNTDEGVGRIYSRDESGRALLRGGVWYNGARAGVFNADLNRAPSYLGSILGFRCSYDNSQQDTLPDAFSFTNQTDVATSSSITSNSLTPTGYDGPLSVSVSGDGSPQISINGGSWTTSTSMSPGDSIEVRLTSSSSDNTTSQATVDLGDYSTTWSVTTEEGSSVDCSSIPGDWVEVPGNSYFGTDNFCVMQFEAKDVSGVATSQPSSTPWVSIDFPTARSACTDLNTEHSSLDGTFKMITNREWMTIARNAEQQSTNWDSSTVGSGSMYRGHSDNNPSNALAVSDIGDYYDGTGNSAPSTERRVLELSNGEVIWDLGGNVWEWVDLLENGNTIDGNACSGGDSYYSYFGNDGQSECTFNSPYSKDSAANTRYEMGPLGDYNADEGVGRIYSRDLSGRALLRGGGWDRDARAGAFTVALNNAPSVTYATFGFRCSYDNSQQDTLPDAFSFTNQTDVATSSSITSNSLTPTGYDDPLSVSVSGDGSPQISINGGSWTTSTSMSPGDSIEVRLTSSSSDNTTSQATVDLGDYSTTWSVTTEEGSSVDCSTIPGDWVEVPGNSYFGTDNFCVMQFEAKDVSGVATSQPSSTPWVSIDFPTARSACTDLNTEHSSLDGTFKMITNREWMTIARNAEQQSTNWDSSTVGSGSMYRGHSDNNPSNALAVSDIGDYYDGTGNSAPSTERRVLELSNGEVIWDLGGNVWEWVDLLENGNTIDGNACSGSDGYYSYFGNDGQSECSFVAPYSKDSAANTRYEMGPLGDYNADEGVGRIYSDSASGRALLRSGGWYNGDRAGPFNARLNSAPSVKSAISGFRCSYAP